jgi:hypothetical protein
LQIATILAPISEHILAAFHTADPLTVLEFYDNLNCRMAHGLPLPPPLTASDMVVLAQAWDALGGLLFPASAFSLGPFYQTLMANMLTPPAEKLLIFSGHDTTVGPLLAALNVRHAAVVVLFCCVAVLCRGHCVTPCVFCAQVFSGAWPPYAAHVIFELWADASRELLISLPYAFAHSSARRCALCQCQVQ